MRELVFRRGVCQRWRGWAGDATDAAFRSLPCEFSAVSGVRPDSSDRWLR